MASQARRSASTTFMIRCCARTATPQPQGTCLHSVISGRLTCKPITVPNIQPEKSKSTTFGVILEPVNGWSTTLDYYSIEIDNQIVTEASTPTYVPSFVRGVPQPQSISDGNGGTYIATPAYGPILYATSGYVNDGTTKTTGLEFETNYKFKLGEYGNLKADFQITHLLSYKVTGPDGAPTNWQAPTVRPSYPVMAGNQKIRAVLTLSYDKGPFNATTIFNWIGSYSVLDPSTGVGNNDTCENSLQNSNSYFATSTYPTQYCKVSSFVATDLTVTYKIDKNWTVHGTVLNLFNQAPPMDLQTYGASGITNLPYNPSLHETGAVGRFFNVGANYKF